VFVLEDFYMRYLNRFSKTLRFSSLFVIVSLMCAPEGWAMDDDWWKNYGEDLGLFDEEKSEASSSGENPENAHTPEEQGNKKKRKRDEDGERAAKYPRTHEESDVSSQRVQEPAFPDPYEDVEEASSNNSSSFYVGSDFMDSESLDLSQNNSSSSASTTQGSHQNTATNTQANAEALLTLGDQHLAEENYEKAKEYYEAAASQGCVEAHGKAAELCLKLFIHEHFDKFAPKGLRGDIENTKHYLIAALDHFEQTASKNQVSSDKELETLRNVLKEYMLELCKEDIDFKKIVKLCESAVRHPAIKVLLGTLYLHGKGVEQDENKALEYFIKASCKKDGQLSNDELGNIFTEIGFDFLENRDGRDLDEGNLYVIRPEQNLQNAIKYFKKAAELDNSESSCKLAELFLSGQLPPLDVKEALPCLKQASKENPLPCLKQASKENGEACYWLGCVYGDPTKCFYDYAESEKYFKRGAKLRELNCMLHYVDDKNLFTAFKYTLKLVNAFQLSREEVFTKAIRAGINFINSSQASSDILDSKGHYNLGKMFSYVYFYPKFTIGDFTDVPIAAEEVLQTYALGKQSLLRSAENQENKVPVGKVFYKLARLIRAGKPEDWDKGIEYANKALEAGIEKSLPLCAKIYKLQGKSQMAAAYFFKSYRKKFSTGEKLKPYFIFEPSTSLGTHSSHVREDVDPNDIFEGKLEPLIKGCEEKYQIHTAEPLHTNSSGMEVSLQKENEGLVDLGPLYKALKDYGDDIEESGRDLLAAEAESSQVGLMVPNVKRTAFMREKYSNDGEGAQEGFYVLTVNDQELSCLGGKNPQKGNKFQERTTTKAEEAKKTVQKIKSIYKRELDRPDLNAKRRTQLTKEQNDFQAIDQAIIEGPKRLVHIGVTRAPLRAKAFEDENKELFKGSED